MYAAINARLNELHTAFDMQQAELEDQQDWGPDPTLEQLRRQRREFDLQLAKSAARDGNPTRLRRMFPEAAEFINPPRRRRGARCRRVDWSLEYERLRSAIDDVYRIRSLWKQHYGRWKRPDSDDIQAEAIAGKRHGLAERQVREAMKRGLRGLNGFRYKLPINLQI